ncbi:hypothetical protein ACPC54_19445 [Kitasatospora sp. NPDC094028]
MHPTPSTPAEDLEDLRRQKEGAEAESTRLRERVTALTGRIRELDERIAAADLRAALAARGPAGLIRRWSELARRRSPALDDAVRSWLAELHPGLAWGNGGHGGRNPLFPVYLWADPGEAGAVAEALDLLAQALHIDRQSADLPRLEVRVMKPRHDPPRLMSPFADGPAATLTPCAGGWRLGVGTYSTSVDGSCLPLVARAIQMGIDARAAEPARR